MSSKTSEGGKTSDDNVSIVKKVEEYFYNSDDFAQIFEDFAIKNAPKVDLSTDECKLEYTEMYNEFHKLYEVSNINSLWIPIEKRTNIW